MTRRATYLLVALVAALVRLVAFTQHLASPLVDYPVLDAHYYDLAARAIAAGESAPGLFTGFRSLLYPRLLALVYSVTSDWGLFAALALQHLAGIATALLVAALSGRLWKSEGAALAAGLVYALGAPPLFLEGELLVEALFTALVAAQLAAFAVSDDRREEGDARGALFCALLAGALAAAGIRLRPNHLLFVAALPLLLLPRASRAARRPAVLAALLGCAATLALLGAWERPLLGRLQIVPGAGGVNLYLGNKHTADGMIPRQDWNVTYADPYRDSVEVFAEEAYRRDHALPAGAPVAPRELSRYWLSRTAEELAADPWGRVRLLGRKAMLLLWNAEVPNNRSFAFAAREEIPLLRSLPVRFGLLLALALAGLALVARRDGTPPIGGRREPAALGGATLLLFVTTHAAGVVLFFVNDRYRVPLWPALAALAGGGASALVATARAGRWRDAWWPLGAAAVGALLAFPNWTGARPPGPGRDFVFRSTAWLDLGRLDRARADADLAARLEPGEEPAWLQRGYVCAAQSDVGCAEESFGRVLALHPHQTAALNALGELRERSGDVAGAHRLYCDAITAQPGFPPPLVAAAWLELRGGLDAEAERHLAALPAAAHGLLRARLAAAEIQRRRAGAGATRRVGIHPSEESEATRLGAELDATLAPGTLAPCARGADVELAARP